MIVLSLIERELRVSLRRPWTGRLRLMFAVLALLTCWVVLTVPRLPPGRESQVMLLWLGVVGLGFSLLAGCFLTADCVSEEKREGTLGLLFLTPLRSRDILAGKLAAHALPVAHGLLAALPVFFLPILNGGVTWAEVSRVLLALGVTLIFSLSAGLFFSAVGIESRTTVLGTLLTGLGITLVPLLYLVVMEGLLRLGWSGFGVPQLSPWVMLLSAFESTYQRTGGWGYWGSVGMLMLLSGAMLGCANSWLPRAWQRGVEEPKRATRGAARRGAGLGHRVFRQRRLEADPYGWAVALGCGEPLWLVVTRVLVVGVFAGLLAISLTTRHVVQGFVAAMSTALVLSLIVKFALALEATRRLHADRRSGALELLLVTPLSLGGILGGVRRGVGLVVGRSVRWLVVMVLCLLAVILVFPRRMQMGSDDQLVFCVMFGGALAVLLTDGMALRWVGFEQALRAPTHLRATLNTFGLVMAPAWVGMGLVIALMAGPGASAERAAGLLFLWHGGSVVYSLVLAGDRRRKVEGRFRGLASEGAG
jgi:ABC-type transport system involved in multi-copper enzyme maturation permease subunit/uncharacterized membrane protein YhaH (DUF805 family)